MGWVVVKCWEDGDSSIGFKCGFDLWTFGGQDRVVEGRDTVKQCNAMKKRRMVGDLNGGVGGNGQKCVVPKAKKNGSQKMSGGMPRKLSEGWSTMEWWKV